MRYSILIFFNFVWSLSFSQDIDEDFVNKNWRVTRIFCKEDTSYSKQFLSKNIFLNEILTFSDKVMTQYTGSMTIRSSYNREGRNLKIHNLDSVWVVKIIKHTKQKLVLRDLNNAVITFTIFDVSRIKVESGEDSY